MSPAARGPAALAAAQRRLHEVFGQVPRPDRIEGCAHCAAPGSGRCLLAGPVTVIAAASLADYAASVPITPGLPAGLMGTLAA